MFGGTWPIDFVSQQERKRVDVENNPKNNGLPNFNLDKDTGVGNGFSKWNPARKKKVSWIKK